MERQHNCFILYNQNGLIYLVRFMVHYKTYVLNQFKSFLYTVNYCNCSSIVTVMSWISKGLHCCQHFPIKLRMIVRLFCCVSVFNKWFPFGVGLWMVKPLKKCLFLSKTGLIRYYQNVRENYNCQEFIKLWFRILSFILLYIKIIS